MGVRMLVGMLALSLILGIGCGGAPIQPQWEGGVSAPGGMYTHAEFGFQICVPEGWYVHEEELLPGPRTQTGERSGALRAVTGEWLHTSPERRDRKAMGTREKR